MKSLNQIAQAALTRVFKPGKTVKEKENVVEITVTTVKMSKFSFGNFAYIDRVVWKENSSNFYVIYYFWSIEIGLVSVDPLDIKERHSTIVEPLVELLQKRASLSVPSHFIVHHSDAKVDMLDFAPHSTLWDYSNEYSIYPLSREQKKDIEKRIAFSQS